MVVGNLDTLRTAAQEVNGSFGLPRIHVGPQHFVPLFNHLLHQLVMPMRRTQHIGDAQVGTHLT